jgi:hypothetical protein
MKTNPPKGKPGDQTGLSKEKKKLNRSDNNYYQELCQLRDRLQSTQERLYTQFDTTGDPAIANTWLFATQQMRTAQAQLDKLDTASKNGPSLFCVGSSN